MPHINVGLAFYVCTDKHLLRRSIDWDRRWGISNDPAAFHPFLPNDPGGLLWV